MFDQHFMTIQLGSLVGGQPDDLVFGLSEDKANLDVGGRHLDIQGIQCGRDQDDVEEHELDFFG